MSRRQTRAKTSPGDPDGVEARIVEVSLQHPDFGARRLLPLLKKEKIGVSPSTIYAILKRHGLQTRLKRISKLNQPAFEFEHTPGGEVPGAEDRIVAVSLQHPDYGAQRLLPLLEAEGISASSSAVYRILRRHGLQNRSMRFLKLEAQQAAEALRTEAVAIPVPPEEPALLAGDSAEKMRPQAEKPQPVGQVHADKVSLPRVVPVSKAPAKTRIRSAWVLTLFNIVLLVLLVYLGFYTVQNLRSAGPGPPAAFAVPAPAVGVAEALQPAALPLRDYRVIWERNLFNLSKEEAPAPKKEIEVEKLALAEKDLGLKLVGTVVADDARLRRAFIDNSKTREQEAYREGDKAGEVQIKKILRNKVIVATSEGDRLLTVEIVETGKLATSSARPQQAAASIPFSQAAGSGETEVGVIEARLKRAQVESGLSENDYLMKQVRIFPYTDTQGEQQGGFRISNIRAGNVLLKLGLRSGDVIIGVDGEAVASPDDAAGFFEKLAQGGDITVQVMRRRRPVQLQLKIE